MIATQNNIKAKHPMNLQTTHSNREDMIKVLIADDHKIVREGLRAMIENQPSMKIVAGAENGKEALAMTKMYLPHIVVMDISMPVLNGIDATIQILEALPSTKIIALSMYSNTRFIQSMFRAGATGYLLKECAFDELVSAILAVYSHKRYVSPGLAGQLLTDYLVCVPDGAESEGSSLSGREREVLQLIAEGVPTRDISRQLNLSIKTVETHRRRIMQKLGITNVAGLTKYAVREGLTVLQ